jgi:hypothetical protein
MDGLKVRAFAIAILALLLSINTALANPEGAYDMTGVNPGNGLTYSGTVIVQHTGDTFQVTWTVNGQRIVGVGIGKSDYLAVSYRFGSNIGLAVYTQSGDSWIGIWAPGGSRELGTETWTRSRTVP